MDFPLWYELNLQTILVFKKKQKNSVSACVASVSLGFLR